MATKSAQPGSKESQNGSKTESANGQSVYLNGARIRQTEFVKRKDAPDDGRYVSLEEYWNTWYNYADVSYEWNNGRLEAKPLTTPTQFSLYVWFLMLLVEYAKATQNVDIMGLETGFTMQVPHPQLQNALVDVVRKPDIAVIRHDNPVQWGENERSYKGICNVCIESLSDSSPSEILRDTVTKYDEYEFSGIQEYFILDPSGVNMSFNELTVAGQYTPLVPTADGIIRSKELPGFQFRVEDLYRRPSLAELAQDEVYQGYVLLEYQDAEKRAEEERLRAEQAEDRAEQAKNRAEQAKNRAEQAENRAEQAEDRAEQAEDRAERYAVVLREMGIEVDEA